ncbi:MAG TPA: hypothetical protein VM165_06720 [Planctomycetaceae bacterium]|nr:hypothetical protein [Planctomycetaceae bacterium]
MTSDELREQIAIEAARLMLRGKVQDFAAARKRAARWLKRKRLTRDEMPSNQEIQVQIYAISGLMASELSTADEIPDDEHPDAFAVFQMLLEPLARVQLDPHYHPEGDALYHSLQVFERGKAAQPYDEEFLLACLLHEVGRAINPRHPVLSAIDALGTLITDRTRFLIEQRPVAAHYLRTGECPNSLRKSPDFEDALLLARCDREGRVAGADVGTLEEALAYLEGLDATWDEEDAADDEW